MRYVTLFLCLIFIHVLPVAAQDGYPLPDNLQPITVENAAHIKPLASLGGLLPYNLQWSNSGKMLIVTTSAGTELYDAAQLQKPPIKLAGVFSVGNASFNDKGELIVDGKQRDPKTGEFIDTEPSPKPMLSPSGKIEIKIRQTSDETIIDLKKSPSETISLHTGTKDAFNQIVFSPDEQYALLVLDEVVDEFNTVPALSYWNVKTGERIVEHVPTLWYPSRADFFADGKLLLIESYSNLPYGISHELKILDGRTGKTIWENGFFMGSSCNRKFFAISRADQLDIWSDHLIGSVPNNEYFEEEPQSPVIFSPNSNTVANTVGKSIMLWDIMDDSIPDKPRLTIPTADTITNLIYSPDGKLLISVEENAVVEVWDAQTGAKYSQLAFLSGRSIYNPIFSRNGVFIRANEPEGDTFGWDVVTGKQVTSLPPKSTFSPDGLHAAFWDGGLVQVVDIPTNYQTTLTVIDNYKGALVAFNPIIHAAIFAGTDFVSYDLQSGKAFMRQPIMGTVKLATFSPDGSRFMTYQKPAVSGQNDSVDIHIWDTNNPEKPLSEIKTDSRWGTWELSPNGMMLIETDGNCGDGGGGYYRVWSTSTGKLLFRDGGDNCGPFAYSFNADNKYLLVGWSDRLDVVDVEAAIQEAASAGDYYARNSTRRRYNRSTPGGIEQIMISPDDKTVALTTTTNMNVFDGPPDIAKSIVLFQFTHLLALDDNHDLGDPSLTIPDALTAKFSPNSRWLLTDAGLWDLTTNKKVADFSTQTVAFSPDSSLLATINPTTHQVELWGISKLNSDAASPLVTFEAQKTRSTYLNQLAFSPDGKLLYLKHEGDIQLWGVPAANS